MGMIPGMGKAIKDVDIDDNAFKGIEAIIHSMTPLERSNPEVINPSRKNRIAKGAGKKYKRCKCTHQTVWANEADDENDE